MSAPAKEEFEVWINYTVFVKRPGDKRPWYKHATGERCSVQSANQDKAMYQGEKVLARSMAERFHLLPRSQS